MIEKEMIEMIREIKGFDSEDEISIAGKKFFEDLKFDSIDIMELVVRLEEKYSVDFASEGMIGILNDCDKLVEFLEKKQYQKGE